MSDPSTSTTTPPSTTTKAPASTTTADPGTTTTAAPDGSGAGGGSGSGSGEGSGAGSGAGTADGSGPSVQGSVALDPEDPEQIDHASLQVALSTKLTLSWSSTGANTVDIDPLGTGLGASGSQEIPTQDTTYTLVGVAGDGTRSTPFIIDVHTHPDDQVVSAHATVQGDATGAGSGDGTGGTGDGSGGTGDGSGGTGDGSGGTGDGSGGTGDGSGGTGDGTSGTGDGSGGTGDGSGDQPITSFKIVLLDDDGQPLPDPTGSG